MLHTYYKLDGSQGGADSVHPTLQPMLLGVGAPLLKWGLLQSSVVCLHRQALSEVDVSPSSINIPLCIHPVG